MNTSTKIFSARVLATTAAALFLMAGFAEAQVIPRKKDKKPPAEQPDPDAMAPDPSAPGAPGAKAPTLGERILKLTDSKDWTLDSEVRVNAGYTLTAQDKSIVPVPNAFKFGFAAFVFPLVPESAASKLEVDGDKNPIMSGQIAINGREIDAPPEFQDGYSCGTRLARFELKDVVGNEATLKLTVQMTCWETTYDDKLAETVPWPEAWPPVAASCFKPQLFIDPEDGKDTSVADLVSRFLNKKDPKSMPPARLARVLANEVLNFVQPSGQGLLFNRNGSFSGFDLIGAAGVVANNGRASEFDIDCLMCAVYRKAGLPARLVVGYDRYEDKKRNNVFNKRGGGQKLRSWVEFCLVDPKTKAEIWIPVDITRMRKSSSRARPADQPQKYFGTHDELAFVQPISFQFHPPTAVMAKSAAFWGWNTNPKTEVFEQWIKFQSMRTQASSDRPNNPNRSKRDAIFGGDGQ